ncbi:MAG TPA: hypothetical protein VI231_19665 [Candidatus Binatia bacterium]|jgi:hypothetical protein
MLTSIVVTVAAVVAVCAYAAGSLIPPKQRRKRRSTDMRSELLARRVSGGMRGYDTPELLREDTRTRNGAMRGTSPNNAPESNS